MREAPGFPLTPIGCPPSPQSYICRIRRNSSKLFVFSDIHTTCSIPWGKPRCQLIPAVFPFYFHIQKEILLILKFSFLLLILFIFDISFFNVTSFFVFRKLISFIFLHNSSVKEEFILIFFKLLLYFYRVCSIIDLKLERSLVFLREGGYKHHGHSICI